MYVKVKKDVVYVQFIICLKIHSFKHPRPVEQIQT